METPPPRRKTLQHPHPTFQTRAVGIAYSPLARPGETPPIRSMHKFLADRSCPNIHRRSPSSPAPTGLFSCTPSTPQPIISKYPEVSVGEGPVTHVEVPHA